MPMQGPRDCPCARGMARTGPDPQLLLTPPQDSIARIAAIVYWGPGQRHCRHQPSLSARPCPLRHTSLDFDRGTTAGGSPCQAHGARSPTDNRRENPPLPMQRPRDCPCARGMARPGPDPQLLLTPPQDSIARIAAIVYWGPGQRHCRHQPSLSARPCPLRHTRLDFDRGTTAGGAPCQAHGARSPTAEATPPTDNRTGQPQGARDCPCGAQCAHKCPGLCALTPTAPGVGGVGARESPPPKEFKRFFSSTTTRHGLVRNRVNFFREQHCRGQCNDEGLQGIRSPSTYRPTETWTGQDRTPAHSSDSVTPGATNPRSGHDPGVTVSTDSRHGIDVQSLQRSPKQGLRKLA